MDYIGNNQFVDNVIMCLNDICSYGGSAMMSQLIDSSNQYSYRNENQKGHGGYHDGYIDVGAFFDANNHFQYGEIIGAIAHESFHALQHDERQGGPSIQSEVEAYVFGALISLNYMEKAPSPGGVSTPGIGKDSMEGKDYSEAFSQLMGEYSDDAMNTAVMNFKAGAEVNNGGLYDSYPLLPNNYKASLLIKYYPVYD